MVSITTHFWKNSFLYYKKSQKGAQTGECWFVQTQNFRNMVYIFLKYSHINDRQYCMNLSQQLHTSIMQMLEIYGSAQSHVYLVALSCKVMLCIASLQRESEQTYYESIATAESEAF